jgi:hypothetical protein
MNLPTLVLLIASSAALLIYKLFQALSSSL